MEQVEGSYAKRLYISVLAVLAPYRDRGIGAFSNFLHCCPLKDARAYGNVHQALSTIPAELIPVPLQEAPCWSK